MVPAALAAALSALSLRLADWVSGVRMFGGILVEECDVLIFGGMLIRTWYVLGGLLQVTYGCGR